MSQVDLADRLRDARARVDGELRAEDRELPKFARLTRKDTLIRGEQHTALTALAKSLMRRRAVKSERITENTLIRVAIDLLFAHSNELHGSTEDELRRSVAPELRIFPESGLPDFGTWESRKPASSDVPDAATPLLRNSVTSGLPKSGSPALTDSAPSGGAAGEPAMAAAAAAPDAPARGVVGPAANLGTSGVRKFGSSGPSSATGLEGSP
ncbi:hypothetical protein ACFVSU_07730 [Microbacterium sp. NPDC058062]|uniref:hypothetical protein n=1 Tax=Microbacterium sp. NPDC058062 TaxID=3346320 RepID=UPI0036DE96E3